MLGFVVIQKEDLVAIEIKVCLVAVKTNLGGSLTKMVIEVITLVTSAIEIIKELIIFIGYKASELKIFGVAVAAAGRVGKSIKIVKQQ